MFDRASSHVRLITPSDCLGAGCEVDDFAYRWSDPDVLDAIVADNRIQDEQLKGYVEDRKQDEWVQLCVGAAKDMLDDIAAQKALSLKAERDHAAAEEARLNGGHGNGVQGERAYQRTGGNKNRERG